MRLSAAVQPKDVVDAYLDAINAHDYEAARRYLADTGFVYQSPIARFDSADAFMEHFAMTMGILQRIERVKTFVDGPDVCSILIVHIQLSSKEQIRFVNWARVENGRIQAIEAVFDARIYQTLFLPPDDVS
jgi:limonene-1,2-epoxide hydrolase